MKVQQSKYKSSPGFSKVKGPKPFFSNPKETEQAFFHPTILQSKLNIGSINGKDGDFAVDRALPVIRRKATSIIQAKDDPFQEEKRIQQEKEQEIESGIVKRQTSSSADPPEDPVGDGVKNVGASAIGLRGEIKKIPNKNIIQADKANGGRTYGGSGGSFGGGGASASFDDKIEDSDKGNQKPAKPDPAIKMSGSGESRPDGDRCRFTSNSVSGFILAPGRRLKRGESLSGQFEDRVCRIDEPGREIRITCDDPLSGKCTNISELVKSIDGIRYQLQKRILKDRRFRELNPIELTVWYDDKRRHQVIINVFIVVNGKRKYPPKTIRIAEDLLHADPKSYIEQLLKRIEILAGKMKKKDEEEGPGDKPTKDKPDGDGSREKKKKDEGCDFYRIDCHLTELAKDALEKVVEEGLEIAGTVYQLADIENILRQAFEAIPEIKALKSQIEYLQKFIDHKEEFVKWMQNGNELILSLLGVQASPLLSSLRSWSNSPSGRKGKNSKLGKLVNVLRAFNIKIKSLIKQFFDFRESKLIPLTNKLVSTVQSVPHLGDLLYLKEIVNDPQKLKQYGEAYVDQTIQEFAGNLSGTISNKVRKVLKKIQIFPVLFSTQDFISRREIFNLAGFAIKKILDKVVLKGNKVLTKAADVLGVDWLIARGLELTLGRWIGKDTLPGFDFIYNNISKYLPSIDQLIAKEIDGAIRFFEQKLIDALQAPIKNWISGQPLTLSRYPEGDQKAQENDLTTSLPLLLSRSRGKTMPDSNLRPTERILGSDLGPVQFHTDAAAQEAASLIHAKAFTIRNQVYFGKGNYQPGTKEGQKLIAHELTHVAQQNHAGGQGSIQRAQDDSVLGLFAKNILGVLDTLINNLTEPEKQQLELIYKKLQQILNKPFDKTKLPHVYNVRQGKGTIVITKKKGKYAKLRNFLPDLIIENGILKEYIQKPGKVLRPHWGRSEMDTGTFLKSNYPSGDWEVEPIFLNGVRKRRNETGATIPDWYSQKRQLAVEVKNWDISEGPQKMIDNINAQFPKREWSCPKGTTHWLVIDVRVQGLKDLDKQAKIIIEGLKSNVAYKKLFFITGKATAVFKEFNP